MQRGQEKVRALVSVFGCETPAELEFDVANPVLSFRPKAIFTDRECVR